MKSEDFSIKVPEGTKEIKVIEHKEERRIVIEFIPEQVEFKIGDIVADNFYVLVYEGTYQSGGILNKDYYDKEYGKLMKRNSVHRGCGFTKQYHLATEEEKALLFSALDKEGYQWNAELKKVEKKRWRANEGCQYWYFNGSGMINGCDNRHYTDDDHYKIYNYFQTSEQAMEAHQKVKELLLTLHS
jgi:hypothetical protein